VLENPPAGGDGDPQAGRKVNPGRRRGRDEAKKTESTRRNVSTMSKPRKSHSGSGKTGSG
jgi:hypothetical protein